MDDRDLERYARHIVLREVGGPGQARLRRARVLSIGAGGLGAPSLLYLAAAGVGTLGIVDDDEVSLSNLQRQILFAETDIGAPKVEAAGRRLNALNPGVSIESRAIRLTDDNAKEILQAYDLILDGCDNFDTRYIVNRVARALGKPLISGALGQWEAQLATFKPGGPCYECIFPEPPARGLAPSCAEAGVIGALPGVIGAMMAMEAIKEIVGAGESLSGRLLLYDALEAEMRAMQIRRRPDCPVCGHEGETQ